MEDRVRVTCLVKERFEGAYERQFGLIVHFIRIINMANIQYSLTYSSA